MVTIASKLPNGVILDDDAGNKVTLNGANHDSAVLGFGLTHNVDPDLWAKLTDKDGDKDGKYKKFPPIVNGSIFVAKNANDAKAMAGERKNDASVQTGLEPLDPDKPGPGVEPTDDQKKANAKAASASGA